MTTYVSNNDQKNCFEIIVNQIQVLTHKHLHRLAGLPHPWKNLNILEKKLFHFQGLESPWIWSKLNNVLKKSLNLIWSQLFEILYGLFIILWEDHSSWGERKWDDLINYILEKCHCWPWKSLKRPWFQWPKVSGNPVPVYKMAHDTCAQKWLKNFKT